MTKRILSVFLSCIIPVLMHAQTTLSVAAAANLNVPMKELEAEFIALHPDIKLNVTFGASGKLAAQILEGAPFDVFLAADTSFPKKVFTAGAGTAEPEVYASGKLVLFTTIKNNIKKGLSSLKDKKIRSISLANPETAPYGRAAVSVLKTAGIYNAVEKKLVFAESISQVVQQVESAADAGFIAKSSLYTKDMNKYNVEKEYWIDVDSELYEPIEQAMIVIKSTKLPEQAKLFYDFILSEKAKTKFIKYGYAVK